MKCSLMFLVAFSRIQSAADYSTKVYECLGSRFKVLQHVSENQVFWYPSTKSNSRVPSPTAEYQVYLIPENEYKYLGLSLRVHPSTKYYNFWVPSLRIPGILDLRVHVQWVLQLLFLIIYNLINGSLEYIITVLWPAQGKQTISSVKCT